MPSDTQIPKGLVFFKPGTPSSVRQKRWIFVAVLLLVTAGLTWPLYPLFSNIYPMLFNLPFSLSWLIILLAITMAGLTWLYRTDSSES